MSHQNCRRRILVRRPELFDDHAIRAKRAHDLDHSGMQLGKTLFERSARIRRDDAGFDESRAPRRNVDDSISRRPQTRIDAEDAMLVSVHRGAAAPLTYKLTLSPTSSCVFAGGSVRATVPGGPSWT